MAARGEIDRHAGMRGTELGRVAIAFGSSPEGALFFQISTLSLVDLLLRKKGDCRGRSAKNAGGFILENSFNFRRRAASLDTDRHDDDDDDGGRKTKTGALFDQLSRSCSKFPRRRSTPTPTVPASTPLL